MAWARVQSATALADSVATLNCAFTANVTSGNKILVAVTSYNGVATSVVDGASNAWTEIGTATQSSTNVSLWALDVPAGDAGTKPTITANATSASAMAMVIQEVSGLLAGNTTAMCDGTLVSLTGPGGASGSTGSPSYTTGASNEYLVSVVGEDENSTGTWTAPASPWTLESGQNATNILVCLLAYTNSTGSAETGSWSWTSAGSVSPWCVLTVAFQLAATGGGVNTSATYASNFSTGAGGSGSWVNPVNAEGVPDSSYATWTAP